LYLKFTYKYILEVLEVMFSKFTKTSKAQSGNSMQGLLRGVVDASMSSVEVGILMTDIFKNSNKINELSSTTASASEEMASTVQGIATSAAEASRVTQKVAQEVQETLSIMSSVSDQMDRTSESMDHLKVASGKIQLALQTIDGISDQTNLLALNASIEAARAGDAGRGFAVVADEVRKLATESQKATLLISETIKEVHGQVENVAGSLELSKQSVVDGGSKVDELMGSAREIEGLMENIAYSTSEQSIASQQISESILAVSESAQHNNEQTFDIMSLLDQLTSIIESQRSILSEYDIKNKVIVLAQADHILWKKKLVDFEMGRINLEEKDMGDHTVCRLGKWYYGQGMGLYKNVDAFKAMEAPHKRVHDAAREAVKLRSESPNASIAHCIEKLEKASEEVVSALHLMEQQVNSK